MIKLNDAWHVYPASSKCQPVGEIKHAVMGANKKGHSNDFCVCFFKEKVIGSNSLLFLFPHRLVGVGGRAEEMTAGEVKCWRSLLK